MGRIFISFAISIILFATSPNSVNASCLAQPISKHVERADIIVAGVPISRLSSYYIFQVDKYYKGSGSIELKVKDPSIEYPNEITSVAISSTLQLQRRHLLYLNKSENDIYKVTSCNGSRPLENEPLPSEKEVLGDYVQSELTSPSPTTVTNKSFFHQLSPYQSSLKLGGAFLLGIVLGTLAVKLISR